MRNKLIFLLVCMPLMIYSQKGITFQVEDLKKPDKLLLPNSYSDILKELILSDVNLSKYDIKKTKTDFQYNIVAQSKTPDSLVNFRYHSFFDGMHLAYADHRPYVISPDMIWLLISQGFARHVNNNAAELRKYFVDYKGKLSLVVRNDAINLTDPNSPWESVFPEFTKQIGKQTGGDLIKTLTCDFTTTTPVSKVASEITIMEAMKPYFKFIVMYISCGIPEITLEGTPEDWQKVLDKARSLRKYKLDWWIDEIEPLLENFVSSSKGDIDKEFWQKMFKNHSEKECGAPLIIDGWIIKFFPYNKEGKRNNFQELIYRDNLPNEIVKVDLEYLEVKGNKMETIPLELWAGFVGLQQNTTTYALKPQIGWMIRKKNVADNKVLIDKLESDNNSEWGGGIQIRVKRVPKELLVLEQIKNLEIQFIDDIYIPDEMSRVKIDKFKMSGAITRPGIERICKLFPNTELTINGKTYNQQ